MKITLIYPPCIFPDKDRIVYSHCLGLRGLSSFLKQDNKHQVAFIDALMLGFDNVKPYAGGFIAGLELQDIVDNVPDDTELIGLSVPFSLLAPVAHDIVECLKMKFNDVPVVLGGAYPSTQPKLALTSKADFILVGEGELGFRDLADGKDPENIQGLYSCHKDVPESFTSGCCVDDLDSLPFPDYSIPSMDKYFSISPRNTVGRTASLITSRGCPFDCEFCSIHPVYGKRWRGRTAENVLSEIQYLVENYNINLIEFEDDNFTMKPSRIAEILKGIIRLNEKGHSLQWRTPNGVRIDTLNEEIIKLISKSNCQSITLALEHGNQEMLNLMNKKLDLNKAYEVLKMFVKYGIDDITLFLIVGYPGETKERFESELEYLRKVRSLSPSISVIVNMIQAYPGTKLLERCKKEGYIKDDDWDNYLKRRDFTSSRDYVAITTKDFDEKEVLRRKGVLENIFVANEIGLKRSFGNSKPN